MHITESKDFPACFHRLVVKGLYVRDGKVLLTKEAPHLGDAWELPGGGLDHGEDPREGLIREIKEELNLDVTGISKQPVYVWIHRFEGCRNMDWYYSVVLAYKIDLANIDFTPTEECLAIDLFDVPGLKALKAVDDLYHQSHSLIDIFNPADIANVELI